MQDALDRALGELLGAQVQAMTRVGGGDINDAYVVALADGRRVFVKGNQRAAPEMFAREAEGLAALRAAAALRVPAVLGHGEAGRTRFLALEWIESGRAARGAHERFGAGLAELHRASRTTFGFDHDNFIGSLPQSNRDHARWLDFFREERLGAQLALGRRAGSLPAATLARAEALLERLDRWLPAATAPSLLHGDLWGGNYLLDERGEAVLIDPATYYGEREIELAFTELFGGFPSDFYGAYRAAWPLEPGYAERRDLYNLYPLLVHANLFGGHYAQRVDEVVRRYL